MNCINSDWTKFTLMCQLFRYLGSHQANVCFPCD